MLSNNEIKSIANEVISELGSDYEEKIYQEAFLVELRLRKKEGFTYDCERVLPVTYKGHQVGFVKAEVVIRKGPEEVVLELKVGGDDNIKEKVKNELRVYLRAINGDGLTRKGFVVMFPCTTDKMKPKAPATAAIVGEVTIDEKRAKAAA